MVTVSGMGGPPAPTAEPPSATTKPTLHDHRQSYRAQAFLVMLALTLLLLVTFVPYAYRAMSCLMMLPALTDTKDVFDDWLELPGSKVESNDPLLPVRSLAALAVLVHGILCPSEVRNSGCSSLLASARPPSSLPWRGAAGSSGGSTLQ